MRRLLAALLSGLLALLVLSGCGSDPAPTPGSTGGTDGLAGDIALRDARIEQVPARPGDPPFPVGGTAELTFSAANTGDATDRVLAITSPVAASSDIGGDVVVPGHSLLVSGYITAPLDGVVRTAMRLTGLREQLEPGRTYPVTFLFERGGAITLQLPAGIPTPDTTPSAIPPN